MQAHERGQAALALRRSFEDTIARPGATDADLVAAFWAYARFESAQSAPLRAQLVLERAVARFPVTVAFWTELTWLVRCHCIFRFRLRCCQLMLGMHMF